MKLNYFPETDSLYIDLSEQPSAESREVSTGVVLDFDAKGNLVGIDIDNASDKIDLKRIVLSKMPGKIETIGISDTDFHKTGGHMIDHTGISVSNFANSKAFYQKALSASGYQLLVEVPAAISGSHDFAGFGEPPKTDFWISAGTPNVPPIHIAFRVATRAMVDAFYQAALAAGGRDNGAPGLRPHYHPNYYGAFVLDPDGHNVEAVCHEPI